MSRELRASIRQFEAASDPIEKELMASTDKIRDATEALSRVHNLLEGTRQPALPKKYWNQWLQLKQAVQAFGIQPGTLTRR